MQSLDLVRLKNLMKITRGRKEIIIGLIDGPIFVSHKELSHENIRVISREISGTCTQASSIACIHGTFVAGILNAKRGGLAPAISPNCTLLVRPIFTEISGSVQMPSAIPQELAKAIIQTIEAGAHLINLSVAIARPSLKGEKELGAALNYAAKRGVIVVAAAGNQGTIGSSTITRHPWVIPVVACDIQGRVTRESNLGRSIATHGLASPGENIISLGTDGNPLSLGGTSVATPFVTGAIALLWSCFPKATATEIKFAITHAQKSMRKSIVPPLLDAWSAYQLLTKSYVYSAK
ncbi:peptidase S8 [Bacillus cereus]|uniref:S8 family serine peptidase n=1 Tax=Bacillus cereus TaxID=1396 RepID=UPI000BEDD8F1|nr:S8 family serine peptidase [Bacillus cereus]PDZ39792.1 peptidase S8 [Bacillus cereus]PES11091.1 peptidase S8 [Bacillus cereus]PET44032.1 peptidase S8 [Bacillus cereus]PFA14374.1 peptidase S8 [Bacillus cereus]PFC37676.1 peptidase S8 [Bacillus cereus]